MRDPQSYESCVQWLIDNGQDQVLHLVFDDVDPRSIRDAKEGYTRLSFVDLLTSTVKVRAETLNGKERRVLSNNSFIDCPAENAFTTAIEEYDEL